jgi:hypothetical protein
MGKMPNLQSLEIKSGRSVIFFSCYTRFLLRGKEACPTSDIVVIPDHYVGGKNIRLVNNRSDMEVRPFAFNMEPRCLVSVWQDKAGHNYSASHKVW